MLTGKVVFVNGLVANIDSTSEVAEVIVFMLTRPRHITIRDVVMMPSQFDL